MNRQLALLIVLLCSVTAFADEPIEDLRGHIALQIHSGQPQTVKYRISKLVHNPTVALAGMTEEQLVAAARTPFSFSLWVKPNKLTKAGILCAGGYGYRHGWLLDCFSNGTVRLETAKSPRGRNGSVQTPAGALTIDKWSHIAVTVDADRNAEIFVDVKKMASGKIGKNDLTNPEALLVVGAIENERSTSFLGEIDKVQIWKKTLSVAEISKLSGGKQVQSTNRWNDDHCQSRTRSTSLCFCGFQ